VPGDVHRLLFLDGDLLDVVRREPPHVVGDGTTPIRGLIAAENARRIAAGGREGVALVTTTLDCLFTLANAGRALDDVPAAGERVRVKATTNHGGPADGHTVRAPVDPGTLERIAAAVAATGLRLAGVDLITTDPAVPVERTGGAVLEVNGNPGLHHHYQVADREGATRVCVPVLRRVLRPPG
jgi:cyanophycin synthetase